MLPPVPNLAHYGVSPTHGFLPEEMPLARLPDPYYNHWEAVAVNLQALILSRRLRDVVDRLPILSTSGLEHEAEWRRAYSLLIFMAHGYIWGGDQASDRLPPPLAVPLLAVSAHLELPPVATYAGLALWNFKPLFDDESIDELENLATLTTFTGSLDESWFYLVSVAIEARGAPTIPLMLAAIEAARRKDVDTVTRCLLAFAERLDDLGGLLQRMHENCDPNIFYNRIRPFLAGSKNMAEAGLPHGVLYDDGRDGGLVYRQYSGGSNAQSSLIQFFDVLLGIDHSPTGDYKVDASNREGVPSSRQNFLMEMRQYMPGPHARFLNAVQSVANIRPFVEARRHEPGLVLAYDACLTMLCALRNRHVAIVARYIVAPSRQVRARSRSPDAARRHVNLATASREPKARPGAGAVVTDGRRTREKPLKGTGGTSLMAFLKQARDETGEPAVGVWAQRFMARASKEYYFGMEAEGDKPCQTADVVIKSQGLACTWTMDDGVGGICNY